jgi:hypothetical protein
VSDDEALDANIGECDSCARLRTALRDEKRRARELEAENSALREELLSAGEMIEALAIDLEKPE